MGERYLIDTNVVIDFFGGRLSENAHSFVISVHTSLSVITQIELFSKSVIPEEEINLLTEYISIADIYNHLSNDIVDHAINIRKEYKIKVPDAIIAATAITNNLTLISRNSKDFSKIKELKFLDPSKI
jgi:predicted nucleic acid-binding protein